MFVLVLNDVFVMCVCFSELVSFLIVCKFSVLRCVCILCMNGV